MSSRSNLFFSKYIYSWFVLLILLVASQTLAAQALNEEFSSGLLFRVSKSGLADSYVFGTIHSGEPKVLALHETILKALENSRHFVMEAEIDPVAVFSSLTSMWLADGRELKDIVGQELFDEVIKLGKKSGMPADSFRLMKPWVVMVMFSLPPNRGTEILDLYLMRLAQQQGKKVSGLETLQEQFDIFDTLPEPEQVVLLRETLKNHEQMPTQYEKLLDAYLKRDLAGLQELSSEMEIQNDAQLNSKIMERLLKNRNINMVKRLESMLSKEACFVAVGALHLPGENGILKLLQARGFEVTLAY